MADLENEVQTKLTKGLLDYILVRYLNVRPMHGYELIFNIRKTFGVYFGPSIVYPLLATIEKRGYISSCWNMENGRPRKIYTLTPEGHNLIALSENKLDAFIQKLNTLSEEDCQSPQE
ncbi:MAG: PadR family transcriptional regulator [Candidatus Bathyarchaeota archaeon]|nr:PadR family transcriptional regulator [Candidatus Termiticorpusculum sp.]